MSDHGLTNEVSVALADVRTLDGAAAEMALDLDMIREMKAETRQSLEAVRKCIALQRSQQRRERRRAPILFLASILRPLIVRQ